MSTLGDLVPGRCRATNLCDYCAKLAAVENAEVLAQDALTNTPPAVWTVTTTRSTVAEMAAYKIARRAVRRAVKRHWPDAECATLVEFTTGLGTRSEGRRRPHWNDMWKGIPDDQVGDLIDVIAGAWCSRVDAGRRGQYAGTIHETGGLMRYLALHFQKESQQPPKGWASHRFTVTRGYLAEPMEAARERARDALRFRRVLWKLHHDVVDTDHGPERLTDLLDPLEVNDLAERIHGERRELAWELVRLVALPNGISEGGDVLGTTLTPLPVR